MGAPNSKTSNSRSWSRAILFSLFIYAATKLPPLLLSLLPHLHTTLYRRSETFDGFGFNASSQCEAVINDLLSNATESNKGGSAAATTLMTLLPALLTFAPLPTANIRDLIYTSPWIAFWTTGMLFGLPSSYASSEGAKRVFSFVDIRTRSGFGGGMGNGNRAITEPSVSTEPPMPNEAPAPPTPHEGLHGLVFSVDPDPDKENDEENEEIYPLLRDLHLRRPIVPHDHEANIPRSRRARLHIWCLYLITISVGAFQTMLFTAMLVGFPLINNMSVIWLCPSVLPEIYSGWLVGSYVLSSLVMMYWNSSFSRPQMLFHLTPDYVYPRRKPIKGRSFREFIKDPFRAREFDKSCSVEHVAGGGGDLTADAKWAEIKRLNITRYKDLEPGIGDFLAYVVKLIAPLRIRKIRKATSDWPKPINFFEYHHLESPLILVIRLSDEQVNQRSHQIVRILGGLCQAIMLILLTFLFGSMYGQRLFLSLYFVLAFTAAIFLCRASSIWASYRLQKATHLTVIECQNYSEMDQAQKLLLTLDNVLIKNKTSGAIFLNRSRVYGHDRVRCWGWPFVLSYFYCGLAYTVCTFVMSIPFTIAWTYNSYKIALFTNIYWNGFLGYMGGMFARADFLENAGHNSTLKESMGSGAVEGTSNGSSTTTTPPSPAGSGPGEQERVDVG